MRLIRSFSPGLLALVCSLLRAQDPPPPQGPGPVGPPPADAAPAKSTQAPEDRPEFDFVSSHTEHPYVEMAGILARDPRTGDLGAIVFSTCPGVGAMCVHGEAGAGIAVVSGNADATWPARAVRALGRNLAPAAAIAEIHAEATESERARQQLMVLAADGRTATAIGERVFGVGKTTGVTEQKDWVAFTTYAATPQLLSGLSKEFPATEGLPLPERLLVSLQRALDPLPVDPKGKRGDLAGRPVAAALLVLRQGGGRNGKGDRLVDLRVDFDPEPLGRLRGLYKVWAAAHLSPALRSTMRSIQDQASEAYRADAEWLRRLRARAKLGEKK